MQFVNRVRPATMIAGLFLSVSLIANVDTARGGTIILQSGNSSAHFRTESTDAGTKGMYRWSVDGVNHVMQQWFWFRIGDSGPEMSLENLTLAAPEITVDSDGDSDVDFLLIRYRDVDESFEIQLRYLLFGGPASSGTSDLAEVIRFENLSDETIEFHFFQYVDFDINGTASDDNLLITGLPENTARQSDPLFKIAETIVTPPPTHYEVSEVDAPNNVLSRLNDADPTVLSDTTGPLLSANGAWSFQWDFEIAPGGSFLISKDKNIRPESIIPEPSTWVFVITGLMGLAMTRRRRLV